MGILRLRIVPKYFAQLTIFCSGCGSVISYMESSVLPKKQYYEDIQEEIVYCTSCIDSGKPMKVKI